MFDYDLYANRSEETKKQGIKTLYGMRLVPAKRNQSFDLTAAALDK
jgi:hypothetical protein